MTSPIDPRPEFRRYDVENEVVSKKIDEILESLEEYPHLDLIREVLVTGVKLAEEGCDRGDLKILRSAVKELRWAFKVFAAYRGVPKVSIFGSARIPPDTPEFRMAVEVGRRMTLAGYMVITGAGGGIMEAGQVGAGREGSFGLNIALPFEQSANQTISDDHKLINFRYFFTRKLFFVKESQGLILLPGGFGTQDEGFEVLTLIQTGRNLPTPVVMLDVPGRGYWEDWDRFVRKQLFSRGLVSEEDSNLYRITESVEEACQEIQTFYRIFHSARYVGHDNRLVLRLRRPVSGETLERLNENFQDILLAGAIEPGGAFPEEADEVEIADLPRLSLFFNRRSFGRLRQLVDQINLDS